MDLEQQLADFKAEFARTAPEGRPALYDAKVEELRATFVVENAPQVGHAAPGLVLPNVRGGDLDLQHILADEHVVLTYYRGGWCPYCNLQLRAYQAAVPQMQELGARLVAVSPQTPDGSLSTAEQNELTFDVLSDVGNEAARSYGLVYQVPEVLREVHRDNGKDLTILNGDDSWELPVPATFVIERGGRVVLSHVDVDYRRRLGPESVLASLRSIATTAG